MHYILRVNGIKVTFAKAQVMDCIKDVCLANPIIAYNAIQSRRKAEFCLFKILKIYKMEVFKMHHRKIISKVVKLDGVTNSRIYEHKDNSKDIHVAR